MPDKKSALEELCDALAGLFWAIGDAFTQKGNDFRDRSTNIAIRRGTHWSCKK